MAQTRLIRSVSAVSDSQGRIVTGQNAFNLGPAEQGSVYKGTVQVPNAPAGGLFSATILGANWGQWAGPTNFGPIQMWGGETLQVTAVGLTPLTNYVLTFYGVEMPEDEAEPVPPAAPMSVVSVETATLLVNGAVPSGAPNRITNIMPPTLTRRISVVGTGFGADTVYALTGDTTGSVYGLFRPGFGTPEYAAIEPTIDATYTLTYISGSGASGRIWLVASFTNPLVEGNIAIPLRVNNAFGTFNQTFKVNLSFNTANQLCIAAQGTLLAIYLQQITVFAVGGNGPCRFLFHDTVGGETFADIVVPSTGSEQILFPGGFKLSNNQGVQVDTSRASSGTGLTATGTFAVGPTV